ncbi:MAG: SusC/RagA family TonB-linked outer membrane protein [Bacteroidales bacterium]|nr:SusC/RagA family TonB-linked outer membrane protein [Bacteroidales bacterium]
MQITNSILIRRLKAMNHYLVAIFMLGSLAATAAAQQNTINGKVTDIENVPLPGVNIIIKGKPGGTVTDLDGIYQLGNVSPADTLLFSYVGYLSESLPVGNSTEVSVKLIADLVSMDEVLVIGYGTQKKSDLTSAIATVEAESIKSLPVTSLDKALAGKAAGVQVTPNTGAPGSKTTIRIRGMNSANNPSPIFVVDGIIMGNTENAEGDVMGTAIDFINPADIESIEILKDASATAIYGSQGAGGVVMITTKKGIPGQSSISFDAYTGIQETWNKADMMNASEFAKTHNLMRTYYGKPPKFPDPQEDYAAFKDSIPYDIDWQDQIFTKAPVSSYTLTYSGGNDKATALVSANYFNQDGIVKTSYFERLSFRVNTTVKLFNNVTVGQNISYGHYKSGKIFENQEDNSPIIKAIQYHPMVPASDAELFPNTTNNWSYLSLGNVPNPIAMLETQKKELISDQFNGSIYTNIKLLKYFTINSTLGGNLNFFRATTYEPAFFVTSSFQRSGSQFKEGLNESLDWQWFNTLTFSKTINNLHDVTVMAGTETTAGMQRKTSGSGGLAYDTENLLYLSNSMSEPSIDGGGSDRFGVSYIARVLYGFDQRYLLTISMRRDGSSKFGPGQRYGNFPAGSIGWRFSNESS